MFKSIANFFHALSSWNTRIQDVREFCGIHYGLMWSDSSPVCYTECRMFVSGLSLTLEASRSDLTRHLVVLVNFPDYKLVEESEEWKVVQVWSGGKDTGFRIMFIKDKNEAEKNNDDTEQGVESKEPVKMKFDVTKNDLIGAIFLGLPSDIISPVVLAKTDVHTSAFIEPSFYERMPKCNPGYLERYWLKMT